MIYFYISVVLHLERFDGNASFTMSAANATLSWSLAPGNISSYRVVVRGGVNTTVDVDGLTYDLGPLTPGTLYDARVYPVKCERDLNPQNASFYTSELLVLEPVRYWCRTHSGCSTSTLVNDQ